MTCNFQAHVILGPTILTFWSSNDNWCFKNPTNRMVQSVNYEQTRFTDQLFQQFDRSFIRVLAVLRC